MIIECLWACWAKMKGLLDYLTFWLICEINKLICQSIRMWLWVHPGFLQSPNCSSELF